MTFETPTPWFSVLRSWNCTFAITLSLVNDFVFSKEIENSPFNLFWILLALHRSSIVKGKKSLDHFKHCVKNERYCFVLSKTCKIQNANRHTSVLLETPMQTGCNSRSSLASNRAVTRTKAVNSYLVCIQTQTRCRNVRKPPSKQRASMILRGDQLACYH